MYPEEAKERAKSLLSDYLSKKNIDFRSNFTCLNPQHEDKHPSMSFDGKRNRCHCFSCGADYDIFDIAAIDTGLSGRQLFDYVYQTLGFHVEYNFSAVKQSQPEKKDIFYVGDLRTEGSEEFFRKCNEKVSLTDYWQKRGITGPVIEKYNLGYWAEKRRVVIPTGKSSYNARAVDDVDKKFRYYKPRGEYELFNMKGADYAGKSIFVVEGEFDALSVIEAGFDAVALGSSGSRKFIEFLAANRPKYPLILCLDNDEAGRAGEEKLAAELESAGIPFVRGQISGEYKDANEFLVADREGFFSAVAETERDAQALWEQKKTAEEEEYRKTAAINEIGGFIDDIKKRFRKDCISTGFKGLDGIFDGGFYPGLYIIGAVSSLGKTTFTLQIADNVAASGRDVLVFSLEMGKQELISKSISRISYQKSVAWGVDLDYAATTRNLMNGNALKTKNQAEFLNEALKVYAGYAGNIFYHIGIGDIGVEKIKSAIEKHIRLTGRKPLVIIDYLQILAPYDMRATDKQNTDKAVVELKRASRDYDVPVLAVSSFNRENYTSPVNLQSFKESGAIEYTSDVLLGLQYKGMDYQKNEETGKFEDEKTRTARIMQLRADQEKAAEIPGNFQSIQLKILKNRNGRKGGVELEFCPMFNTFREPEEKALSTDGWQLKVRK